MNQERKIPKTSAKQKALFVVLALVIVTCGISATSLVENVPAGYICIIQSPISGDLAVHFEPGLKWQGFGRVHMYPRSGIYEFLSPVDPDDFTERGNYRSAEDKSIKIQFNDSGAGWISGSMRYDYPLTKDMMEELHKKFQGHINVINGLIKPNIERVINMTGPLMSSIESSRTRRAELPMFIEDQLQNGLYLTITKDVKTIDEITGQETTIKVAEIIRDANGNPRRQSTSIVTDSGMRAYNINMNKLNYEEKVLKRLDDLFTADSEKQISYMKAIKAEQDAKTAEQEGRARATAAEWDAKTITASEKEKAERDKQVQVIEAQKQKEVAMLDAQKKKDVAELDKQTAALYKDATLLRADADATYKRKVMEADGALTQKLATYESVMFAAFKAIGTYQGAWVPSVIAGQTQGSNNAALDMLQLLSIKAAKDLGLDMSMTVK